MPSPFPGMDPYIELYDWADFHSGFLNEILYALVPQVRPKYIVRRQKRVYIEHDIEPGRNIYPDVAIAAGAVRPAPRSTVQTLSKAADIEPLTLTLPMPETIEETYLTLVDRESLEVVTVIELLSPANKRSGADGMREYLAKREEVLQSPCHLVEIDLLRGGARLPTREPLPNADYFVFLASAQRRPSVNVYHWTLHNPLPTIPIPLSGRDKASLDLQAAFDRVYDRTGYDYSLDYSAPLRPAASPDEQHWIDDRLKNQPSRNADTGTVERQ